MGDVVILYLNKRDGTSLETIIDLEDLKKIDEYNHKWYARYATNTKSYYAAVTIYNKDKNPKYTSTNLNYFLMECPENKQVDHINHNTLDNRKSNLRIVDIYNNSRNRKTKNINNTSGYRNVSWSKSENSWIVQLQINSKNTVLGHFTDIDEAGKFAEEMRKKYYGEYAGNN